ncbi:hypothetical protein ACVI1K_000633 [Bradyrhizobium sp. USDA 4508]
MTPRGQFSMARDKQAFMRCRNSLRQLSGTLYSGVGTREQCLKVLCHAR